MWVFLENAGKVLLQLTINPDPIKAVWLHEEGSSHQDISDTPTKRDDYLALPLERASLSQQAQDAHRCTKSMYNVLQAFLEFYASLRLTMRDIIARQAIPSCVGECVVHILSVLYNPKRRQELFRAGAVQWRKV
nr:hypothetical protein CFP56_21336 [Quercus suber]